MLAEHRGSRRHAERRDPGSRLSYGPECGQYFRADSVRQCITVDQQRRQLAAGAGQGGEDDRLVGSLN